MQKYRISKKIIGILLIVIVLVSSGCTQSNSTTSYSAKDMIDSASAKEQAVVEEVRRTMKEDLDRHYGNGLYFEDLDDVRSEFQKSYEESMEKEFGTEVEYPYFVKAEVEFYNDTLKKAKDEGLTYADIADAPEKHIRKVFLKVFLFCKEEDLPEEALFTEKAKSLLSMYKNMGVTDYGIAVLVYDPKVLETMSVDDLRTEIYPMRTLDRYNVSVARSIYEDDYIKEYKSYLLYGQEWINLSETPQKDKYNREYVYLWEADGNNAIYADKENFELTSETCYDFDKFLTLKAQKAIGDKINQIIEEEGGSDFIVQYTAPRSFDNTELDTFKFDMKADIDDDVFLKEIYPGVYDVSLIYMKDETTGIDDIDYEMLYRIASRIKKYKEDPFDVNMGIYFYDVASEERPLISALFKRDMQTSNYFEEEGGISDIYATMYKTREETDGFHYLDVYGAKEKYMLHISSDPEVKSEKNKTLNNVEIMRRYISSDMFGGGYNE